MEEALAQKNVSLLELAVDPQIADLDRAGIFDAIRFKSKKVKALRSAFRPNAECPAIQRRGE